MHYHCEIWLPEIPTGESLEELVAAEMAPFCEDGGDNPEGWWDWYEIGGRWVGAHDDYDPAKDLQNYSKCDLCRGTGTRPLDLHNTEVTPGYCNGCTGSFAGPGMSRNFHNVPYSGDIIPIDQLPTDFTCFRLIAGERVLKTDEYQRNKKTGEYERVELWDGDVKRALGDIKGFLVTVDYHS